MGTLTLIRHGQANSSAREEADYDRLSQLGWQQSRWLGDWFTENSIEFDLVLCGNLRRHKETAEGIGHALPKIDPRLDELDYFNLSQALADNHGIPFPSGEEFANHMPRLIEAWYKAEIMGHETFGDFEDRVSEVLSVAIQPGRHVLCVTSGGVIGMMMRHLLKLDITRLAHVLLPIMNTSVHRIHVSSAGPILAGFNAVPHLDRPDRAYARTYF